MTDQRRQAEAATIILDWLRIPVAVYGALTVHGVRAAIDAMNSIGLWRRKFPWKLCMRILEYRLAKGQPHA